MIKDTEWFYTNFEPSEHPNLHMRGISLEQVGGPSHKIRMRAKDGQIEVQYLHRSWEAQPEK